MTALAWSFAILVAMYMTGAILLGVFRRNGRDLIEEQDGAMVILLIFLPPFAVLALFCWCLYNWTAGTWSRR